MDNAEKKVDDKKSLPSQKEETNLRPKNNNQDSKLNSQNQTGKNDEDHTRYGDWVIKGHAIDF